MIVPMIAVALGLIAVLSGIGWYVEHKQRKRYQDATAELIKLLSTQYHLTKAWRSLAESYATHPRPSVEQWRAADTGTVN